MTYSKTDIKKAKDLRTQGKTYELISKETGIPQGSLGKYLVSKRAKKSAPPQDSVALAIRHILNSHIDDTTKLVVIDCLVK